MVKRGAFSMIEMVFAIVIIGITVAGVSQMMTRSGNTMEGAFSQEAVFLASMEGAKIFSHRWDANSMDNSTDLSYSKILDTGVSGYRRTCIDTTTEGRTQTSGACGGADEILSVLRLGGIAQDKHRRFHSDWTTPAGGTPDGIPDGNHDLNVTDANGYKHEYRIATTSGFATARFGTGTGGTSDIKVSEVSVQDKGNGFAELVKMRIYSYNIGEIDYAKRIFQ